VAWRGGVTAEGFLPCAIMGLPTDGAWVVLPVSLAAFRRFAAASAAAVALARAAVPAWMEGEEEEEETEGVSREVMRLGVDGGAGEGATDIGGLASAASEPWLGGARKGGLSHGREGIGENASQLTSWEGLRALL
jgi:hypothetical protein